MKKAYVYSDGFASASYGGAHPMRPARLGITRDLTASLGLLNLPGTRLVESRDATDEEMLLFHSRGYLDILKQADSGEVPSGGAGFGLGFGDNPVFPGVYAWSRLCTGGTVNAAEMVASGEVERAMNISGGLHHAMPAKASGFCYINDPAVAIAKLVRDGHRVAYVDIDAHHGDGVEHAFYGTDRVLTISIHESGRFLFPGTGDVTDTGAGEGKGFAVNLPLEPGTGDETWLAAFDAVVPDFMDAFAPDVLMTQLGCDCLRGDPITHLALSLRCFEEAVKRFRSFGLPWVAVGGGGYDMGNVARAWTLAWAAMSDADPPDEIPEEVRETHPGVFDDHGLRGNDGEPGSVTKPDMAELKRKTDYLRKESLPLVKAGR